MSHRHHEFYFQVGMAAQWNVSCTQCGNSKNGVASLSQAVMFLLDIHSCHKIQGPPATVKSHFPSCVLWFRIAVRGGSVYEPHLKSNVCFFAVVDLRLIEPVRLTQACSLSLAVPAGLVKSCLLAGNMHLFVCLYVCFVAWRILLVVGVEGYHARDHNQWDTHTTR
jgi:hypothetical protein